MVYRFHFTLVSTGPWSVSCRLSGAENQSGAPACSCTAGWRRRADS